MVIKFISSQSNLKMLSNKVAYIEQNQGLRKVYAPPVCEIVIVSLSSVHLSNTSSQVSKAGVRILDMYYWVVGGGG